MRKEQLLSKVRDIVYFTGDKIKITGDTLTLPRFFDKPLQTSWHFINFGKNDTLYCRIQKKENDFFAVVTNFETLPEQVI